jgi:F-type H+-transporting ATPase subunit epsilon
VLNVSVVSPEALVFQGQTDSVVAPGFDGEFGILSDHAPMLTLLGKGTLRIGTSGEVKSFAVEGGFLQVVGNTVRVVTERATPA